MKGLFSFLAVGLILISAAFVSESSSVKSKNENISFRKQLSEKQANTVVENVYTLNGLVRTEIMLDTSHFGVCDTCSGSFSTALKVNRELVESVNKENGILYEKYIDIVRLNKELDNIKGLVSKELEMSKRRLKHQ